MGAVLDFILFLVALRALWRLASGVMSGMKARPRAAQRPDRGIQMARDPMCGTFVVPERAVTLVDGRQHLYFCSTACRDQYRAQPSSRSKPRDEPVEGRTA